jgi:hypothetical protein
VKKLTGQNKSTSSQAAQKQQRVNEYIADSWEMKCDFLADWANTVLTTGSRRQEINANRAMQQPNDVDLDGEEEEAKPDPNEIKLLTPEEDLAECVHPKSCHPQQTCLFILILKEASVHQEPVSTVLTT